MVWLALALIVVILTAKVAWDIHKLNKTLQPHHLEETEGPVAQILPFPAHPAPNEEERPVA